MSTVDSDIQFAVCIAGEEDGDLEVWKVYRVLPDPTAYEVDCLRIIDESSEDYLYPQRQFVILELPDDVQERLLATVEG
ncbi:MAG: hypothetical protein AAFQ89_05670 [Cyanobacteria bacterium J06626_18]